MIDLVAIGASWGGLRAISTVLRALPSTFAAAVVVVQHRAATDSMLAPLLDRAGALPVRDADDKDPLRAGEVLVAPADYHLLVDGDAVALSVDAPVRFSRPSIDVLFETAAQARGDRVVAVVLTGSNADGAAGLMTVRRHGGIALVQEPADAERPEMPSAALRACPGAQVRPLAAIGPELVRICGPTA
ncbi:MAG: chemotaxis response regulator protein-glutamate methylesterase CheB [Solirubrobacterales bacterium]|jgi:two-component system chemotaxis response regulator CheB|nr:chemotaxis response regulator protein-glutamate methylesterase CheB [Solirubrobacterales bacterium]